MRCGCSARYREACYRLVNFQSFSKWCQSVGKHFLSLSKMQGHSQYQRFANNSVCEKYIYLLVQNFVQQEVNCFDHHYFMLMVFELCQSMILQSACTIFVWQMLHNPKECLTKIKNCWETCAQVFYGIMLIQFWQRCSQMLQTTSHMT